MSKEAIVKIKEAEAEALNIRNSAVAKAKEMLEDAERNGKAHCASVEKKTSEELDAKLASMRVAADRAVEKSNEEANEEAETICKIAKIKMHQAVKVIIGGILEECQ